MSTTVSPPHSRYSVTAFKRRGADHPQPDRVVARGQVPAVAGDVLARHVDRSGRRREVVLLAGAEGSRLLIDRDESTLTDRRLLAHLAADEPPASAQAVCRAYLDDPDPGACRRVLGEDLRVAPPGELQALASAAPEDPADRPAFCAALGAALSDAAPAAFRPLIGPAGEELALRLLSNGASIPQLRWCERAAQRPASELRRCSVRDVVGRLQSYEPVRTMSARAILAFSEDREVSVAMLAVELQRLACSRIVLNRGLRERALAAVARGEVSMSEIALRCGMAKRDARGILSGETTWLARRLGLAADGTGGTPTPWVHSDLLARIARDGLGVSPREVEVA